MAADGHLGYPKMAIAYFTTGLPFYVMFDFKVGFLEQPIINSETFLFQKYPRWRDTVVLVIVK